MLLGECKRVLRRGGVIRLVVPDVRSMVASYLKNKNGLHGERRVC